MDSGNSGLPPGYGENGFEADYARAQTWVEAGLAGASKSVLTKMAYNFSSNVVDIIKWMLRELKVDT